MWNLLWCISAVMPSICCTENKWRLTNKSYTASVHLGIQQSSGSIYLKRPYRLQAISSHFTDLGKNKILTEFHPLVHFQTLFCIAAFNFVSHDNYHRVGFLLFHLNAKCQNSITPSLHVVCRKYMDGLKVERQQWTVTVGIISSFLTAY